MLFLVTGGLGSNGFIGFRDVRVGQLCWLGVVRIDSIG